MFAGLEKLQTFLSANISTSTVCRTVESSTAPELDSLKLQIKSYTKSISNARVHCYQVPITVNEW